MNFNDKKIKLFKKLYIIFAILYVAIIIMFLFYGKGWNKISSETVLARKVLSVLRIVEIAIIFLLFSFSLFKYKLSNEKNAALEYESLKDESKKSDDSFKEQKIDSKKNLYYDYFIIIMLIALFAVALLYKSV